MKFRWQGATYDTSAMEAFPTENAAMPVVYLSPDNGGVFVLRIDRQEGAEVSRADALEAKALAERYRIPKLLEAANPEHELRESALAEAAICHALIVEDDAASRHAVQKLLTRSGYNIACAATLAEAETKLPMRPRCLILDLHLPDGSSVALMQKIRAEGLPIRVALTTGSTEPALLGAMMRLKPDAFFRKPYNITELLNWLDNVSETPAAAA